MKKFLSILVLIAASLVCSTCSSDDNSHYNGDTFDRIDGYSYMVQDHNLGKGFSISYLILENGWNTGEIQACYLLEYYTRPGTFNRNGGNVSISGLSNPASPLNGSWSYEYDDEYNVHILRSGSKYVIFW